MPRKIAKKERGLFEKVPGSGIWWIRYEIAGIERREKVGRRGDAIKLYAMRKADSVRGVKLPANMKPRGVKFKVIAQEAIDWYINHKRKDVRNFKGRMALILETFGDRVADEIKPSEIDRWIGAQDWSPATKNRYKNVFGKTFKIALADGKVTMNPARLVEQRPENNARIRYLLEEEEKRLLPDENSRGKGGLFLKADMAVISVGAAPDYRYAVGECFVRRDTGEAQAGASVHVGRQTDRVPMIDDIVFKRFVTNSVTVSPSRHRSVGPGTEPFTAVASPMPSREIHGK